jgi:hypothetical protein
MMPWSGSDTVSHDPSKIHVPKRKITIGDIRQTNALNGTENDGGRGGPRRGATSFNEVRSWLDAIVKFVVLFLGGSVICRLSMKLDVDLNTDLNTCVTSV